MAELDFFGIIVSIIIYSAVQLYFAVADSVGIMCLSALGMAGLILFSSIHKKGSNKKLKIYTDHIEKNVMMNNDNWLSILFAMGLLRVLIIINFIIRILFSPHLFSESLKFVPSSLFMEIIKYFA